MTQLRMGDVVNPRRLVTIHGRPVQVPDAEQLVHLQFRRYAGCPVCNLHLRSIACRHDEIVAAGVREVAVFHSSAATMLQFQGQLPFAVIADPELRLYTEFGVKAMSRRAALNPRSWLAAGRALARASRPASRRAAILPLGLRGAAGRGETHLGLPADFLIGPNGRILALRYGRYVTDQWSVDQLLTLTGRR